MGLLAGEKERNWFWSLSVNKEQNSQPFYNKISLTYVSRSTFITMTK